MAKEQLGLGEKIKGFFERINNLDVAPQEEDAASKEETVAVQEEFPPEEKTDPMEIPVEEGPLLELWRRWEGEKPLVLSMNGDQPDKLLPLNSNALERERSRLRLQLDRDARKHLVELMALDKERAEQKAAEEQAADKEPTEPTQKRTVEGVCHAYLSEDRMVAWCMAFPPSDPEVKLQLDQIGKAMQASGITTGLDSVAVTKLFQQQAYFRLIPIAVGTPVVEGEDGRIIERLPRELPRQVQVDDKGEADYRSLNNIQLIKKGDVICDIVPPKEGTPGVRVDGKVLEPKPARAQKAPSGRNTTISEDGLQLTASQDGHLLFQNGTFQVKPVLDIPGDVDYSTGNIDFLGDVHIHGNVRANFSVRAAGTLTIDGLVEASIIESGGDLIIASGVLGDYKAVIKSKGEIHVKYLENCVAYTAKSIYADCMMLSQVFSDDTIDVTSGRGTIIGGSLTAGRLIKARLLGSQAGRKTKVTLGIMPFVQEELSNNQAELNSVRTEMQELDKELRVLVEQKGISGDSSRLSKAQLRKSVLAMKEMQLLKALEQEKPCETDLSKCRLESSTVYPITQIDVGPSRLVVDTVQYDCKLKYDPQTEEITLH